MPNIFLKAVHRVLVSKEFSFSGAHHLPDYKGKCERLHGHTWFLRVTVRAPVQPNGIAFDFAEIGRHVNELILPILDHSTINDTIAQASAERIAQWIWRQLVSVLPLYEIRVWESPQSFVTYRGEGDA